MTTSLATQDKSEAKKKGLIAAGTWGGAALLLVAFNAPILATLTAGGAAVMTYKWFMYRAKRGMRF
jgi:hypothetical protein